MSEVEDEQLLSSHLCSLEVVSKSDYAKKALQKEIASIPYVDL